MRMSTLSHYQDGVAVLVSNIHLHYAAPKCAIYLSKSAALFICMQHTVQLSQHDIMMSHLTMMLLFLYLKGRGLIVCFAEKSFDPTLGNT